MKKPVTISLIAFLFIIQGFNSYSIQNPSDQPLDDTTNSKFKITQFLNFNDSLFNIQFRTLPNSALNYKRFTLVSDHNQNYIQYNLNSSIQQYIDEFITGTYSGLKNQYDAILTGLSQIKSSGLNEELIEYVNATQKKEIFHSVWRANLVHIQNELELTKNITKTTQEMISQGYNNLSKDLLPFITMLMLEQKKYHYDDERVIFTKPGAKGIINAIQILNSLGTLDKKIDAGVCRDVHDMGLRIVRPMYRVYLDEKYPNNNYNVDDYIFLQAWVTPSSQHITLVVLDPVNTRNFHELDWGRIYKKENQEGVEIGKMVGTTIRLWQFDPKKNVTGAFNMVKNQWGIFLDNNLLKSDENWSINGIYNPQYASSASYELNTEKKSKKSISLGMLNAGEKSLSYNFRSNAHKAQITKLFQYSALVGFQAMVIDDTQRKSTTMTWTEWHSVVTFLNSIRYISTLKSTPLKITPNLKVNLYALSQLEVVWSITHFETNDIDFDNSIHATGDGNIWLSWGTELNYSHNRFEFDFKFGSRNFLIPTDVRLMSPNPFELIRHATIANSGSGVLARIKYKSSTWLLEPEFRYEQNKMDARFMLYSLKVSKTTKNRNQFFIKGSSFNQIQGLEYYWYAKTRFWFDTGFESYKKQFSISLFTEAIQNDFLTFGISFRKFLN
ncbi:MAG: hypothetical protein ABFS35_16070 [Bacteroidota bacterium]